MAWYSDRDCISFDSHIPSPILKQVLTVLFFLQILPEDAHRRVSKALHISITDVYTGQNKVISSYATRAELIDVSTKTLFIIAYYILPKNSQPLM